MKEKKYFTIYKRIKEQILNGEYPSNSKLPSKRMTANKYGCSVITVETAYNMLSEEGYVTAIERSGYYVNQLSNFQSSALLSKPVTFEYLSTPLIDRNIHDFEYDLWFKTIRKVISERGQELFIKSPSMGCAILRNALADYLYHYRGMLAQPNQIIIGSGAEQLYEIVVKLLGRGRTYGIEYPSYSRIEAVYTSEGANICKLKLSTDGIESTLLQERGVDVLHVTPFRSYPTNVTTSIGKRQEYLNWATSANMQSKEKQHYIVEDDYNSEFFIPGQPVETLYALDHSEVVIYMNTFSKSLSPSMRIGYMILPPHLLSVYENKLGTFSCSVPVLDQYVLAEYISSGNFERHLNRERRKRQH